MPPVYRLPVVWYGVSPLTIMHTLLAVFLQWITDTQTVAFKDWIVAPVVGAAVLALLQRAITASRNKIHLMMTDNANRTRDDIMAYLDKKFKSHELAAFERLTAQEELTKELDLKIAQMQVELKQIADSLRQRSY